MLMSAALLFAVEAALGHKLFSFIQHYRWLAIFVFLVCFAFVEYVCGRMGKIRHPSQIHLLPKYQAWAIVIGLVCSGGVGMVLGKGVNWLLREVFQ
jgi:uncharacterized membrane protein